MQKHLQVFIHCVIKSSVPLIFGVGTASAATVYAGDSTLVIENTSFIANGSKNIWQRNEYADDYRASTVVCAEDSDLTLIGGKFTDNN